jgi:hypothetical protein
MCLHFQRIILLWSSYMLMELVKIIMAMLLKLLLSIFTHPVVAFHQPLSPISILFSNSLPLVPINDPDIQRAFKTLRPTKPVALDYIPDFVIRVARLFYCLYVFSLSVSQKHFPTQWGHQYLCLFIRNAIRPACKAIDLCISSIIFQKSLNFLCMTIWLIILNENWSPVNMTLFKPNLLLPSWYRT